MQRFYSALLTGLTGLCLGGCSAPTSPTPAYPQNPAISDAQGWPWDSTTFYFPPRAALPTPIKKPLVVMENGQEVIYDIGPLDCQDELNLSSYCLTYFDAPVLSNYYLGADIYRFLWYRSFHRPVLLTLHEKGNNVSLRTQLLDKAPGFTDYTLFNPDSLKNATFEQKEHQRKQNAAMMADPEFQKQLARGKRRAEQVTAEETTIAVTPQQRQHFQQLLNQCRFTQLHSCTVSSAMVLDGAYWILESHQANGYHMVFAIAQISRMVSGKPANILSS